MIVCDEMMGWEDDLPELIGVLFYFRGLICVRERLLEEKSLLHSPHFFYVISILQKIISREKGREKWIDQNILHARNLLCPTSPPPPPFTFGVGWNNWQKCTYSKCVVCKYSRTLNLSPTQPATNPSTSKAKFCTDLLKFFVKIVKVWSLIKCLQKYD